MNSEKSAVSAACGAEPHFCFEESADALYPELSLTIGNDGHYGMPENERIFPIVQEAVQHKMKHQMEKAGVKKIRVHAFIVISCRGFLIIYGLRRFTKGYYIKQLKMDCQPTEFTALSRHRAVFSWAGKGGIPIYGA